MVDHNNAVLAETQIALNKVDKQIADKKKRIKQIVKSQRRNRIRNTYKIKRLTK
jgi:hypothetical protein